MQSWRVRPDHRAAVSAACLCILLVAALAGPAHARVALSAPEPQPTSGVFVSPAGSDATGSGTLERPYRTLGRAAAVVRAGQTVYVRGGVYSGKVTIARKASRAAPIAFKPYPGESVVLNGSGVTMGYHESLVTIWKSAYVKFEGFEIRNSRGRGLSVLDGNHVIVRANTVHDTWSHPIMGSGDHLTFDLNHIYNGVQANVRGAMGISGWPPALSTWSKSDGSRSTDVTFRRNHVHDTWGEGIGVVHVDNVNIVGNTIHDVWSVNIYMDSPVGAKVERNRVSATNSTFYRNGSPAKGIMIGNEYYSGDTNLRPAQDIRIASNTIVGVSNGVAFWVDTRRTVANSYRNVRVYHNVIKDTKSAAIWFQDVPATQPQPSGNVARNNIIYRAADGSTLDVADLSGWSFLNNDFRVASRPAPTQRE